MTTIRAELGPDAHLTIDANQSYAPKDAIRALNLMAPSGIDLAEQPVKANDLIGLKAVTQAVPITVEADEAAYSLDQVMILVRERIVDAISLKITKLGGLRKTYAAAQICAAGGVRYRMGAHVGPMLLAAHAMQLAAALPGIWYASELTEFDGLAEDRWEGLKLVDGVLHHSDAIGCGVTPKVGAAPTLRACARAPDMGALPAARACLRLRRSCLRRQPATAQTARRRHPDLYRAGSRRKADRRRQEGGRAHLLLGDDRQSGAASADCGVSEQVSVHQDDVTGAPIPRRSQPRLPPRCARNNPVGDVIEGTGIGELAVRAGFAQPIVVARSSAPFRRECAIPRGCGRQPA